METNCRTCGAETKGCYWCEACLKARFAAMTPKAASIVLRCRVIAERLEALDAETASMFTPDTMREAAALLRGYSQALLLMELPAPRLVNELRELADRAERAQLKSDYSRLLLSAAEFIEQRRWP